MGGWYQGAMANIGLCQQIWLETLGIDTTQPCRMTEVMTKDHLPDVITVAVDKTTGVSGCAN